MPVPSTRADIVSSVLKNQIQWSDIPTNFDMAPNSGDLAKVTNGAAVAQSLENLVMTVVKERLYQPTVGSTVAFRAFELASPIEAVLMESAIMRTAKENEPRVNVIGVQVNEIPGGNAYQVLVYYYLINNPTLQTLSVILKRTR